MSENLRGVDSHCSTKYEVVRPTRTNCVKADHPVNTPAWFPSHWGLQIRYNYTFSTAAQ